MTYQYTYISQFEALAPAMRQAIFSKLQGGPLSVKHLAESMPISRPAVSQHLKVLKSARLVQERREGVKHFYSIDQQGLSEMRDFLDGFWDTALINFQDTLVKDTSND